MGAGRQRPEYQDPSRFPCSVVGCEGRAAGWVHRDSFELFGLDYEVEGETELAYLCEVHLRPVRRDGSQ